MSIEILVTSLAFGVSMALFVWTLYLIGLGAGLGGAAGPEANRPRERWVNLLLLLAQPLGEMLDARQRRNPSPLCQSILAYYQRQIRAAGLTEAIRPSEVAMMIPISGALGLVAGGLAYILWPWPFLILLFAVAGMVLPGIWLRDQVKRRHEELRRWLPFAIDLLTLMIEAGLDFSVALQRISQKLRDTALGQELDLTHKEILMGKHRADALRHLAARVNLFELSALCSALVQAEEFGTGLGHVLRVQADFIRTGRAQQVEQMAMEAPVKILFPLVLFIFPTTFVILFGPIFLSYML